MRTLLLCCILCLPCTRARAQDTFTTDLPIIVIDTRGDTIVDEPKIMARMGIIAGGGEAGNRPTDPFDDYDGLVGIEIRGSSSQSFPKRGFGLETRDSTTEGIDVSLLGLPEEEDWVLHGPYSDKSLIRNALAYSLAGEIMDYAPRVRMVELVINGDYRGVYLFTEKIKRDRNRVDVNKLKDDENSGDDLTGGYLLKLDKATGEDPDTEFFFESRYNGDTEVDNTVRILYDYPKPRDITAEQRRYISNWMHAFESRLAGDDFLDPETGYRPLVNLESFVDYLIVNEMSRNVDGYRLSTWMYKDKDSEDGRLHMGPVWDFNLAFGNANYCGGAATQGWGYDFGINCPDDFWQLPFWWDRLREDPAFTALLRERWAAYRAGVFSDAQLTVRIDSFVNLMVGAADRNFARWPVLGEYVWPNVFLGETHAAEIDYLKTWLLDRVAWMDSQLDATVALRPAVAPEPLLVNPNPSDGVFRISAAAADRITHLAVVDALGRPVYRREGHGATDPEINLGGQPAGIYYLRAWTADRRELVAQLVRR